jgi:hypothetical protein
VTGQQFTRVVLDGQTVLVRVPQLPARKFPERLRSVIGDPPHRLARAWRKRFAGIRLLWFHAGQKWYVLRTEVGSLYGRIRILRARKVLELGLQVGRGPSLCENRCSCTCHSDRTPYIRRLYQFHELASLGDLLILEEVLKTAGKIDACTSCNGIDIQDA